MQNLTNFGIWTVLTFLLLGIQQVIAIPPANKTYSVYDLFVVDCFLYNEKDQESLHDLVSNFDMDLWREGVPKAPANCKLLANEDQLRLLKSRLVCDKAISLNLYEWMLSKESVKGLEESHNGYGSWNKKGFFDDYQSFSAIQKQLKNYATAYPGLVKKVTSIGTSIERRAIPVIHITGTGGKSADKKTIWISGGQHAREWIAPAAVMFVLDRLLVGYISKQARTVNVMDEFEFVIAPVLNPDGYEYSRTQFRYWRKNRRVNGNGSFGVDLNRNWDNHWNEVGTSMTPSSDIYCGRNAASEPEVALTQDYILKLPNRMAGIDVHSYGAMVLRNYGWTYESTAKETYLKRLGDAMAGAMNRLYNSAYTSDRSSSLYPTGGSMDDWMFDKTGMPGFTIELRDHGEYGFLLPAKFIIPTGEELLAAVKALANEILLGE